MHTKKMYIDAQDSLNVPTYKSESDLPAGSTGDIAYIEDEGELYVYS